MVKKNEYPPNIIIQKIVLKQTNTTMYCFSKDYGHTFKYFNLKDYNSINEIEGYIQDLL